MKNLIFFTTICLEVLIPLFMYSQDAENKQEKEYLQALELVIANKNIQEILKEYNFNDTIFIQRERALIPEDKVLNDFFNGKTVCLFSNEMMFFFNVQYWLRVLIIKWDDDIEVQIKTCSTSIVKDLKYYKGTIILKKRGSDWIERKYQVKKIKPTRENVKWNSLYPEDNH